jgi:hypothetical protein
MNPTDHPVTGTAAGNSRWQRLLPIFALIFLAPFIAEVSSGATRLSFIFVLIPEMMVWGCGALLIREFVRRWHAGWTSMFLLGLGLSVAEEFVIQQTSLAPLPWVASPAYGRIWGVNLIYFIFMLGFESVMVVLVPVQLTELLFPARRTQPWLKKSALCITSAVFLLGSFIAGFLWIKIARDKVLHVPHYPTPVLAIVCGVAMIFLLALASYAARNVGWISTAQESPAQQWSTTESSRSTLPSRSTAPSPWIVGIVTLLFGFPWYLLMTLIFGPRRDIPLWISALAAILWAGLAYVVARRFTSSPAWGDMHRWSAVFCAALVSMLAGFGGSDSWSRTDFYFKAILNVVIVVALSWLAIEILALQRAESSPQK